MPTSALKPCRYPGCPELVRSGYCATHTQLRTAEENRLYHDDPQIKALYNSNAWKRIRIAQLAREPWCAECLKQGIYTVATDIDHVQPHHGDRSLFFKGPFQSLCHVDHSRKTAGEVFA